MAEKDLPYVCAIERVSFPNPWHEMTFIGEIHNKSISFPYVVVHKKEERVIGYVIFWHVRDEIQISNIAIHPDFRRKGIGLAVMRQILELVKRERAKFISLEVRPSNSAALNLYKKLGFEILAIRKDYYHNPKEHALIMGKRLNQ